MRRFVLFFVLACVLLATVWAAAQNNCMSIRGLGQAWLAAMPPNAPIPPHTGDVALNAGDYWGGYVILTVNGMPLDGVFSGQDGDESALPHGKVGAGKHGSYTFAFNLKSGGNEFGPRDQYQDYFFTDVPNAVWPGPPGKLGFGYYQAAHKIVGGSGIFKGATGNILVSGTAAAWPLGDPNDPNTLWKGMWNPEISGNICLPR